MSRALCSCILLLCACTTTTQPTVAEPKPVKDVTPLEKQFADHPDDPKVNLMLGDRSAAGGDWLRAQQYYERAEALGTVEEQIVPRMLRVLVMGRRYDDALERCRKRLGKVPTDRATRFVEAAIYEALDRPREAERELNVLVRTKPDDPNPYLALGKLYRDTYSDVTRARAMFTKYLQLAPKGDEADAIRYQLEETTPEPLPEPTSDPTNAATPKEATP